MKTCRLQLGDRSLVHSVFIASSMSDRMKGLLGRGSLPRESGMLIQRCSSIHTFFMRFRLDVIFVDRSMRVVRVVRDVAPFRMVFGGWSADAVLEVESGWLDLESIAKGTLLQLSS